MLRPPHAAGLPCHPAGLTSPTECCRHTAWWTLLQVHEMISVSAIQETQASAVAAFEDFMDSCMDAEWQVEKRALFDTVMPYSAPAGGLSPGSGGGSTPGAPRSPLGGGIGWPGASAAGFRGAAAAAAGRSPLATGNLQLRGRAAKYADVVRKLNQALASKASYSPVGDFAAACADEPNGERRTTMVRVWRVLERVLAGAAGLPVAAHTQQLEALLAGSRKYLEQNFVAYMNNVVQAHRAQVQPSGVDGVRPGARC